MVFLTHVNNTLRFCGHKQMALKTNEENLRILVESILREATEMKSTLALASTQGHMPVVHAVSQKCMSIRKLTDKLITRHDSKVFCFGCCIDGARGRASYWIQTPATMPTEKWIMENLLVEGKSVMGGKEPLYRCQLMDKQTWMVHFADTFGCGEPHLVHTLASIEQLKSTKRERFDKWKHAFHPAYFDHDPAFATATVAAKTASASGTKQQSKFH